MEGRYLRFRWLAERLRGVESDTYRATRDGFSARVVLAVAVAIAAVVFALRMLNSSQDSAYSLFYCVPIALLALRFGVRGGLIAAVVAEGLFVISAWTVVDYSGVLPYVTRGVVFFTLGTLVGYLSEQLATNEARFGLTLSSSQIFVFTMDRNLRYTWIYHGWTGRVATEMVGLTDADLVPPEYAEPITALKRHVLETGEAETAELPARDREGDLRWFRIAVEPARDGTGRVSGLVGSALDITELREAYHEIELSEERFRTAVENMLEPFALYSSVRDETGEIVDFQCEFINQPGADSVGMEAGDMCGQMISELFPGRLEYGLIDRYRKVVETGEPHVREEVDYVNVFGEETLVRGFDIQVAKFGDGIEITWRDITARKRAERERDWAAAIVYASIDAIMSADTDGIIRGWSTGAQRLYGWTPDEVVGTDFRKLMLPPEGLEVRNKLFGQVVRGESVGPVRATELCKDGTTIDVTFTATPIKNSDGSIGGVARIVRPTELAADHTLPPDGTPPFDHSPSPDGDGRATSPEARA